MTQTDIDTAGNEFWLMPWLGHSFSSSTSRLFNCSAFSWHSYTAWCTVRIPFWRLPTVRDTNSFHAVFLTTIPSIFQGVYHEKTGIAGLHYLSFGLGILIASQVGARLMDRTYAYLKTKMGGQGRPEFRLRTYSTSNHLYKCSIDTWLSSKSVSWNRTTSYRIVHHRLDSWSPHTLDWPWYREQLIPQNFSYI